MKKDNEELMMTLTQISKLLPKNTALDDELIKLIRVNAQEYIQRQNHKRITLYTADNLCEDIEESFKSTSSNKFEDFPLSLTETTVKNFLNNQTHYSKSKTGINPSSGSIRTIAALLVVSNDSSLAIEDLAFKRFDNKAAQQLSAFMGDNFANGDFRPSDLRGFYKFDDADDGLEIELEIIESHDRTHFFVEEINFSLKRNAKVLPLYGWGVITPSNLIIFFIENHYKDTVHFYVSTGISVDKNFDYTSNNLNLTRFGEVLNESSKDNSDIISSLKKNTFYFSKSDEKLTKRKPLSDNTQQYELSVMSSMSSRFSMTPALNSIDEGHMDEETKIKLSKELLAQFKDELRVDFEKVFSLLDQGASINYQDPRIQATAIHHIAQWDKNTFKEALSRSKEEYNFLLRDRKGRLASWWATADKASGVYDLLIQKEIEYGKSKKIWPGVLRDMPWPERDEEPNSFEPE